MKIRYIRRVVSNAHMYISRQQKILLLIAQRETCAPCFKRGQDCFNENDRPHSTIQDMENSPERNQ